MFARIAARGLAMPGASALLWALAVAWVILAPFAAEAGNTCWATGSGTWGPVSGGTAVWSCGDGAAPTADDFFVVPPGIVVDVTSDVVQSGADAAGIEIRSGGVLRARVTPESGPLRLVLGPAGLRCASGAICEFRGGYRSFRPDGPSLDTELRDTLWVGDVIPCDGDDGEGPIPDCQGLASRRGNARTVRFDYPAQASRPSWLPAAVARTVPSTDIVCFFQPDTDAQVDHYLPAEVNQCFDLVGRGGGDHPFLRVDVTQSRRAQPGFPIRRKRLHEVQLSEHAGAGEREVHFSPGILANDGHFVARWVLLAGESGRPEGEPYRILDTRREAAADVFTLGDPRGLRTAHDAGDRAWITYGWAPGDRFVVIAPVRITSATEDPDDSIVEVGDADLVMEAVWLDDLRRVDARGNGVHSYRRVWFRDPTPARAVTTYNPHAFHVDHRQATEGRFRFQQVNVTGGDSRSGVCGADGASPCTHDAIHWANAVDLLLEDVAARYVGFGCFFGHAGDKSSVGSLMRRLSCEFVVDDAPRAFLLDFKHSDDRFTRVEDIFCGDCGRDGESVATGVGPAGELDLEGLTVWGSRSVRLAFGPANHLRNVLVAGGRVGPLQRLPDVVDRFVFRDVVQVHGTIPLDPLHGNTVSARNGFFLNVQSPSGIFVRPAVDARIVNVGFLDVRTESTASNRILLRWPGPPSGASLEQVLVWFPAGSSPRWHRVLTLPGVPTSFILDGLFVARAQGDVVAAVDLASEEIHAISFDRPQCFFENAIDVRPGTEALYPADTLWEALDPFTDEMGGNLLPRPVSTADDAGCGLDPLRPPGQWGRRFGHWLTKTPPELIGRDADGDGIPEVPGLPPCGPGDDGGCTDSCPTVANPSQEERCRNRCGLGFEVVLALLAIAALRSKRSILP